MSEIEVTRNRRRAWIAVGFMALVGCIAVAPWINEWWRSWEAGRLGDQAAKLAAAGDADRAVQFLVKAWNKKPEDPSILRKLARRCDETQGAAMQAATFWEKLSGTGRATAEDRLALATALGRINDWQAARAVFNSLPPPMRATLKGIEVEAGLLANDGREEEASKLLLEAWRKAPDDPSARFHLAKVEFSSPFADVRDQAGRKLWEIAGGSGRESVEALEILAISQLTLAHAQDIRDLISRKPGIANADRLRILAACIRQFPKLAAEVVAEESRRVEGRPPESIPEFYEWLARLGMAERILRDLAEPRQPPAASTPDAPPPPIEPKPAVLESRALFLAYGDALITSERWKDFAAVLSRQGLPVGRCDLELMEAICARGLSQAATTVEAHLSSALKLARAARNVDALSRVAEEAEKFGFPAIAIEAFEQLSADRRLRLDSLKRMHRLQQDMMDPDGRLRTAEAILELQPGKAPYADEALYLSLLTGVGLERALHHVETAPPHASGQDSPLNKLARALAAYQCGDIDSVRQRVDSLAPASLAAGPRAVLAGLLAAAGRIAEAFRVAEKIPAAALTPDELWFHRKAVRGHGDGS